MVDTVGSGRVTAQSVDRGAHDVGAVEAHDGRVKRGGADLSRERIVDAAVEVLADKGVDGVSLTAIAHHLGVSQPAMYRHVGGIDDLWRELGRRGRAELTTRLADAAMGRTAVDAIEAVAHAWRGFALSHPDLYTATDRVPCAGDPELEGDVAAVVDVLAKALRGFDLDAAAGLAAAQAVRSALHGFVHLEIVDGLPEQHDNDASFAAMVAMVCVGLERLALDHPASQSDSHT